MAWRLTGLVVAVALFAITVISLCSDTHAQGRNNDLPPVYCWAQPNGANSTIMCNNGFWRTITPEGEEIVGMGVTDPNEQSIGGNFVINKGTGGPNTNIMTAPVVTPPMQTQTLAGPGQAELYGNQPRY